MSERSLPVKLYGFAFLYYKYLYFKAHSKLHNKRFKKQPSPKRNVWHNNREHALSRHNILRVLPNLPLFSWWFSARSLDMCDWDSRGRRLSIEETLLPNGNTTTARKVRIWKIDSYIWVWGILEDNYID